MFKTGGVIFYLLLTVDEGTDVGVAGARGSAGFDQGGEKEEE
jgi:hypothetical protein